jgi:hypothetical protein
MGDALSWHTLKRQGMGRGEKVEREGRARGGVGETLRERVWAKEGAVRQGDGG